jgi:hypothetical protein
MFSKIGLPRWGRTRFDWSGSYREPYHSQEDEVRMLKEQAQALKYDLKAIERRLNVLKAEKRPDE